MPNVVQVPIPRRFDFNLTAEHKTHYRGRAGSDLFVEGTYYRALWVGNEAVGVAARSAQGGEAVEVSLPNGGPEGVLNFAAAQVVRLLGLDIDIEDFYGLLSEDTVLDNTIGHFRGLHPTRSESVFEAMIHAVIGQQISSSVAGVLRDILVTTYGKDVRVNGHLVYAFPKPRTLLEAGLEAMRALKLSGRKAEYVLGISERALEGELEHETFAKLSDDEVMESLLKIRGVGRWTVQWVLMTALGRIDALPAGDLALQKVVGDLYFDGERLKEHQLETWAEAHWKPYRGLATTYLFAALRRQRAAGNKG